MADRARSMEFESYINVGDEDEEVTVIVSADYTPGCEGSWYATNGDPGEPPVSADVEITGVCDGDGKEIGFGSLDSHTQGRLIDAAWENAQSELPL